MMLGRGALVAVALAGCSPDYSPNTYNGSSVQQANKVDTGVVIGYREVRISDDGSVGAVTGGAAGGILGAEASPPTLPTALIALGGTVVGGVVGATLQHTTGDTKGWEYIVRQPKGDLVSVTQREPKPIPIGQKVLVIEGKQARIIPDYATASLDDPTPAPKDKPAAAKDAASVTSATVSASTAAPVPAPTPPDASNAAAVAPAAPVSAEKAGPPSEESAPPSPAPAASSPPASAPAAP
jgi:outer membrane lipoprotein SlyB